MMNYLLVAFGGALGASSRYGLSNWALRQFGPGFPVGTLLINIIGSALMGALMAWLASRSVEAGQGFKLFLCVGLLGGFTTFSAFTLEGFMMLEKKAYGAYVGYVGVSVLISLLALALGFALVRMVVST